MLDACLRQANVSANIDLKGGNYLHLSHLFSEGGVIVLRLERNWQASYIELEQVAGGCCSVLRGCKGSFERCVGADL